MRGITRETERLWGEMDAAMMFRHLRFNFDLSLGKEKGKDISNVLTRTVLKWLFFHVFTNWPKGKLKAPPYFFPELDGEFEEERRMLEAAMEEFCAAVAEEPERIAPTPLLGRVKLDYWRRIHGIHCDHHLRQFGV